MSRNIRKKLRAAGLVLIAVAVLGAPVAAAEVATMSALGSSVVWSPESAFDGMTLTVSGGDVWVRQSFAGGQTPSFDASGLPDGTYNWEITVTPRARGRRDGGSGDSAAGRTPRGPAQSGAFTIANGVVVDPNLLEPTAAEAPNRAGGTRIAGDLVASGAKSFVAPDPDDSERSIYYAALEGPEAGTYYRGTARTVAGRAVIELPEHFSKVTEAAGLTVQITPVGAWSRLYVEEMSPARLVVADAEAGDGVEFSFLIQGVRKGYADFEVERSVAPDAEN